MGQDGNLFRAPTDMNNYNNLDNNKETTKIHSNSSSTPLILNVNYYYACTETVRVSPRECF